MGANVVTRLVFGIAVEFQDVLIAAKAWDLQKFGRRYLNGLILNVLQQGSRSLPREILSRIREELWNTAFKSAGCRQSS